jgi:hypothetical protein
MIQMNRSQHKSIRAVETGKGQEAELISETVLFYSSSVSLKNQDLEIPCSHGLFVRQGLHG